MSALRSDQPPAASLAGIGGAVMAVPGVMIASTSPNTFAKIASARVRMRCALTYSAEVNAAVSARVVRTEAPNWPSSSW